MAVREHPLFPWGPTTSEPNEELVKLRLQSVLMCLLLTGAAGWAQNQAPAQPPVTEPAPIQSGTATLAAPKEVPSTVNTGHGLSFEPIYWITTAHPVLRGGSLNFNVDPGNFDYLSTPDKAIGGRLNIPAGQNATIRVSYFQTQSTGFATAPMDLNLFGQLITKDDPLATRYRIEAFKLSYDYLTYFWKRQNSEIRLKTLWEVQRVSVTNEIDDFVLNTDGTYSVNPALGSRAVLYPTFGLGIEHTLSRHFRWDARASGFALPHRAVLGDMEANAAFRFGHIEFLGGFRSLHFKTNAKNEFYNSGTLYGPYVSLRYYWKKQ
jgi:hypothetical protein